jgi:hypothetical protein
VRKLFTSQRGAVPIFEVLLLLLVVGVLGLVSYRVYTERTSAPKQAATTAPTPAKSTKTPVVETKLFTSKLEKLSFKYPATWKLETSYENENVMTGDPLEATMLTGPNGTKVQLLVPVDGIGGACDDTIPVNNGGCPLQVVLSVEKLNVPKANGDLYLVKEGICSYTYGSCKPQMGIESGGEYLVKVGEKQTYPDYVIFKGNYKTKYNTGTDRAQVWFRLISDKSLSKDDLAKYFDEPEAKEAEQIFRSISY